MSAATAAAQEGMAGIRRSHITAHSMDMISMGSRVAAVMEDNRTIHLHPRSSNIRMHTEGKASISTISSIKRIRDSRRMRRAGTVGPWDRRIWRWIWWQWRAGTCLAVRFYLYLAARWCC